MSVFRVQLKPSHNCKKFSEVLDFCRKKGIIGVGWAEVNSTDDSYDSLKKQCDALKRQGAVYEGDKGVFKAVNAIRQMKSGDYVWTREGGSISNYYLCKVNSLLWKDRIITSAHLEHDIANYVGCDWIFVGTEDKVPGKVVNSFRARATVQHINDVESISDFIWNKYTNENKANSLCYEDFWKLIGSEELECLVLLYLQSKGYYIYSSTIKSDTKTYEAILISNDGKHRCYPQVKHEEFLDPKEYSNGIEEGDKAILFSSSENYGKPYKNVECLSRTDIWNFIKDKYYILPESIKYWVDLVK